MNFHNRSVSKSLSNFQYANFFVFLFWFVPLTSSFNLTTVSFEDSLSPLFGDGNLVRSPDDQSVRLLLDRFTGSGFISSSMYQHGFFSAMIKLPADYTAGVVVAFYTSNGDVFEKTHDELDFEFLGNIKGKPWRFQTNLYGNGSTFRGREERYRLWFDPSKEFHRYSILWNPHKIIFWVDNVPIREVIRREEMGVEYPQKPMSLYATIWDASDWATSGGRYKANYKYAPFVTEFKSFALEGCPVDPIQEFPDSTPGCSGSDLETRDYSIVTPKHRAAMRRFRQQYMYYSYCYDAVRYPELLPECVTVSSERERFRDTGRLKFGGSHKAEKAAAAAAADRNSRRRGRRRSRVPIITSDLVERR